LDLTEKSEKTSCLKVDLKLQRSDHGYRQNRKLLLATEHMKNIWLKAVSMTVRVGAALSLIASSGRGFAQAADPSVKSKQESPLACNAFALSPEQMNRHFGELGPALRALKKSVRELDDGYEFEFPAEAATLQLLAEWTIQERMCCPFFDINLRLERDGGPLWLRLTGRKGTKEFIKMEAAAWISQ
jgi:hypothetical protein